MSETDKSFKCSSLSRQTASASTFISLFRQSVVLFALLSQ
jgi:hypothetical protein